MLQKPGRTNDFSGHSVGVHPCFSSSLNLNRLVHLSFLGEGCPAYGPGDRQRHSLTEFLASTGGPAEAVMPHKLLQKLQFIQELEGFYSVQKSEQEMEIAVRKS